MNIELINTGTELLLGSTLNTHQQWIGQQLAALGLELARQVAVPDTADAIQDAVRDAMGRADFILTTGGLGPTSDDVTREKIAELLGLRLCREARIEAGIQRFFEERRRSMPAQVLIQAQVPEGAQVLENAHGTAPGLAIPLPPKPGSTLKAPRLLVMLPGPPRELRPMFTQHVLPLLRQLAPSQDQYARRILRTTGVGESVIAEKIEPALRDGLQAGLEIGYCAHTGAVDVRLIARGPQAHAILAQAETTVREFMGEAIYGENDDRLEAQVVQLLTAARQTVALAESCTGGFITHRLTNIPGASAVVLAGAVTYSNTSKTIFAHVDPAILQSFGAVSPETATAMAEGIRRALQADYGIGVTGIAGPSGGTEQKPVGTVYIALAQADGTKVHSSINRYERESFKAITSQQALDLIRRALLASRPRP
jgi:nicotinamide-nucleotide amidase